MLPVVLTWLTEPLAAAMNTPLKFFHWSTDTRSPNWRPGGGAHQKSVSAPWNVNTNMCHVHGKFNRDRTSVSTACHRPNSPIAMDTGSAMCGLSVRLSSVLNAPVPTLPETRIKMGHQRRLLVRAEANVRFLHEKKMTNFSRKIKRPI